TIAETGRLAREAARNRPGAALRPRHTARVGLLRVRELRRERGSDHGLLTRRRAARVAPCVAPADPVRASREREKPLSTGFRDGPWRNRTSNLGIKSPLLCQLS